MSRLVLVVATIFYRHLDSDTKNVEEKAVIEVAVCKEMAEGSHCLKSLFSSHTLEIHYSLTNTFL